MLRRELVDDLKRPGSPLGGVDRDRAHGYMTANLQELVAVRRVVAVKAPDATQAGGAGSAGLT